MKDRDIEELLRDAPLVDVPESLDHWARGVLRETKRRDRARFVWRIPGWVGVAIGALCFGAGWRLGQTGARVDAAAEAQDMAPVFVVRDVVSGEPFTERRELDIHRFFASTQQFRIQ